MRPTSAALILSLAAGGANAQDVASATDPQSLLDQFEGLGMDARLEPYESGRQRIRAKVAGVNYALAFYGCLDDMTDCRGMMFTAGFDMAEPVGWEVVNDWNETRVYSRAFIDEEGDPYVQMPVPTAEALSEDEIRRLVDIWESAVIKFTDTIGFERSEDSASAATPAPGQPVASGQPATGATATTPSGRVAPKKAPGAGALGAKDQ